MKMNIREKKALYTFGCPNHKATIARLRLLALSPRPRRRKAVLQSCSQTEWHGRNVSLFLLHTPNGNGSYYDAELTMKLAEVSTCDMEGDYGGS